MLHFYTLCDIFLENRQMVSKSKVAQSTKIFFTPSVHFVLWQVLWEEFVMPQKKKLFFKLCLMPSNKVYPKIFCFIYKETERQKVFLSPLLGRPFWRFHVFWSDAIWPKDFWPTDIWLTNIFGWQAFGWQAFGWQAFGWQAFGWQAFGWHRYGRQHLEGKHLAGKHLADRHLASRH